MRVAARHERHAARRADRTRAGSVFETHRSIGKTIEMIRIDDRVARESRDVAVVLIRYDPENIRVITHMAFRSLPHIAGFRWEESIKCSEASPEKGVRSTE